MTVLILISVEECDCHKKDNQMNIHYIYVYCGRTGGPSVCKWNRFIILFNLTTTYDVVKYSLIILIKHPPVYF